MVLVDTSVWVDFFNNYESPFAETLTGLIKEHNRVVICGLILQEVLQGIRDGRKHRTVRERLERLPFINTDKKTYLLAADLYRRLRRKGLTVPPVDVTIAAIAITSSIPLYTKDAHFWKIEKHSKLKLFSWKK